MSHEDLAHDILRAHGFPLPAVRELLAGPNRQDVLAWAEFMMDKQNEENDENDEEEGKAGGPTPPGTFWTFCVFATPFCMHLTRGFA